MINKYTPKLLAFGWSVWPSFLAKLNKKKPTIKNILIAIFFKKKFFFVFYDKFRYDFMHIAPPPFPHYHLPPLSEPEMCGGKGGGLFVITNFPPSLVTLFPPLN